MPNDLQLLLIEDADPIIARKVRWFEDPAFKDKGVNTHKPASEQSSAPDPE